MVILAEEYDRIALEEEYRELQQKIDDLKTQSYMIPQSNPPVSVERGTLAYSDGTVNWDGIAASEGLYRYTGSAWVKSAELASPTFTGTPAAPTASLGTNTTQLATTAFVKAHTDALIGLSDLAQTWRIQANVMGDQTPLKDFAVANDAAYGSLGTTMGYTNSTGVFKFPEKGFYVALFQISLRLEKSEIDVFARIQCDTQNGSGFTQISQTQLGNADSVAATRGAGSCFALFDVKDATDVSNFEVRFVVDGISVNTGSESTSTAIDGSANQNITSVTFVKIANS